ncbi:MAG: hypothetical protein RMK29_01360 [Myxococcales bacterium]|nr:DUF11 domain-containing protein [Myxococcota bacterium]MDW8280326.1 hypothetical protein [Myxococcales bacterium]
MRAPVAFLPPVGLALCLLPAVGVAAPRLRVQTEQRGDFLIFGNTVGFDCRPGIPNPVVGSIDRNACGANTSDTAIDVFWRSDDPAVGQVRVTRLAAEARSTAVLVLPPGATVTYARIYWSGGLLDGAQPGRTILIERPGVFSQTITADASWSVDAGPSGPGAPMGGRGIIYQSTAEITPLLQRHGAGPYRVGGIASIEIADKDIDVTQMVWSVVVFYRREADPPRNLALFDGLDQVARNPVTGESMQASAVLSGFVIPPQAVEGRVGLISYEGDHDSEGDYLQINDRKLSDALNPENNFFNATRSVLGRAVSIAGDLPQMTGGPGSMNGYDVDVLDLQSVLKAGDTRLVVTAGTVNDIYFLGAFVTAVGTFKPLFTETRLSVADLTAPGAFAPGNEVEFTLETRNTGNDDSLHTYVEIQLPPEVSYTPGSLQIVSGEGAGPMTDAVGDDLAEYLPGTHTVRVRIGRGATARLGGRVSPADGPTVIRFRGRIDSNARGRLQTQAIVTATGVVAQQLGIPPYRFFSYDERIGHPGGRGSPTLILIKECDGDGQCSGRAPGAICTAERVCGCRSNADCSSPATCDVLAGQCVLAPADIQVQVRAEPEVPTGLIPVKYTVEVSNLGPGTAPGVQVVVSLPPGATVEDLVPGEGWMCQQQGDRLICTRDKPLPPGKAPIILFSVLPGPTPAAVVVIEAASRPSGADPTGLGGIRAHDPDHGNNVATFDLDGSAVFKAAGGGFGCAVVLGGQRARSAVLLLTLLLGVALAARWSWGRRRAAADRG